MKPLYKQILNKITPTENELKEETKLFAEIMGKVENINGKHSHLEWCGSSARGTHLRGDRDLDLFVMFSKELSDKDLEKEGLRIGKNVFRGYEWEKAYSQHPYIRGNIRGFDVEIVPGFIVKSGKEKKSAVDRTPFHNKFLLERLTPKMRGDVRLLKQFMKGINAYGADLKNRSLPGYGFELLIVNYSGFDKTIKAISKWNPGEVIAFKKVSKKQALKNFESPLIIIDPVDDSRNVASALSFEQFERMIFAAQLFLKKPSKRFFFGKTQKTWPKAKVKAMLKKKELIAVKAKFPKTILSDLFWGQLRKFEKKIAGHLREKDFEVTRSSNWSNEDELWFMFEVESLELQTSKKIVGPFASDEENVEKFLEKKRKILSGPRVEGGRVVMEVERKETNAKKVLQNFIKKSKREEKKGLRSSLKSARVVVEKEMLEEYKGEFAEHLTRYLEGRDIFE